MSRIEEHRECDRDNCPYRTPSINAKGKKNGYCSMIRSMIAVCCPAEFY